MESICCCAATENGTVDVQKKDFVMGKTSRILGYGSLMTVISLLPNFAANAQGPNPGGGDPKTEQVAKRNAEKEAGNYSHGGKIGIVVYRGQDVAGASEQRIENYLRDNVLTGLKDMDYKLFYAENENGNNSVYVAYANGSFYAGAPNGAMKKSELISHLPQIKKQALGVVNSYSYNNE